MNMKDNPKNRILVNVRLLISVACVSTILGLGCGQRDGGQFISKMPSADSRIKAIQDDQTMQPAVKQQMIAMIKAHAQQSTQPQAPVPSTQ